MLIQRCLYFPTSCTWHRGDRPSTRYQVDALEAALTTRHPHWLGFCHNDLQCGNVMLDKSPPRLVRRQHAPHRTADMSISQVGLISS